MKKYYQALLAIVAVVSLISLLFYRHEYNKLHYVLEVFNSFGRGHQSSSNSTLHLSQKPIHVLSEPLPSWLRVNDNLFLYSSYNIDNKQVRTIAFGKVEKNIRCAVYFAESNQSPIYGTVDFYPIKNSRVSRNDDEVRDSQGYYLNCEYEDLGTAVGVKYFPEFSDIEDATVMAVRSAPSDLAVGHCAACLLPNERFISLEDKLAFLGIQNLVGIRYFLTYDFGIDSRFNAEMRRRSNSSFVYDTLPWNFPYPKVESKTVASLVQADCLLRTRNVAEYATTIRWGDFLVPKYHDTIERLIFDLRRNRAARNNEAGLCHSIPLALFCSEDTDQKDLKNQKDDKEMLVFKLTMYALRTDKNVMVCEPHEVENEKNLIVANVSSKLIKVHRYGVCSDIKEKKKEELLEDEMMLQFREYVLQSIEVFKKEHSIFWNDRKRL